MREEIGRLQKNLYENDYWQHCIHALLLSRRARDDVGPTPAFLKTLIIRVFVFYYFLESFSLFLFHVLREVFFIFSLICFLVTVAARVTCKNSRFLSLSSSTFFKKKSVSLFFIPLILNCVFQGHLFISFFFFLVLFC